MALIEWQDAFNTGIPDVDHEHRQLVDLINELHDRLGDNASPDEVSEFLGEVWARIAAHFALEEAVMRERGYDEYAAHKAEHDQLLDELRGIMEDFEAGVYSDYQHALAETVREWFVRHFKTKDARLHRMLGV